MNEELGLLVALDALLDEAGVSAAAARVHVSQPAMSRTLSALRRSTGDAILVREGARMVRTPYAEQIRAEVRELVLRGRIVLSPHADIEPASLMRTFSLLVNEALAMAVVPELMAELARVAPGVTLRLLGEPSSPASARTGVEEDARLGEPSPHRAGTRHVLLGSAPLMVLGAAAVLPKSGPELDAFADYRHVIVSRRGRTRDRIDDVLEEAGRARRVVTSVPTVALALQVVSADPGAVTIAPSVCLDAQTGKAFPALRAVPLPFPTEPVTAALTWPERLDADPGQRWFRSVVSDVTSRALPNLPGPTRRGRE